MEKEPERPGELAATMPSSHPIFIVGIGGSAGGLVAYKALLDALPPDTGMAFVVVSHFAPAANSQLAEILSRHTTMPVAVASMGMSVAANRVYVCAPNTDLLVENHAFKLVSPRTRNKQIDILLSSLAENMGTRAIGIILSGHFTDGTDGCRQIKAKGGMTFAQDGSAEASDMSLSAQASGCVDFVLPPDKIADELRRLARTDRTAAPAPPTGAEDAPPRTAGTRTSPARVARSRKI